MKIILLILSALFFQPHILTFSGTEPFELKRSPEYRSKIPIKVIKKVPLPKGYHEGIYLDGDNIWVSNGEGKKTWIVDPGTGEVISEIEPSGDFTEAVTKAADGTDRKSVV